MIDRNHQLTTLDWARLACGSAYLRTFLVALVRYLCSCFGGGRQIRLTVDRPLFAGSARPRLHSFCCSYRYLWFISEGIACLNGNGKPTVVLSLISRNLAPACIAKSTGGHGIVGKTALLAAFGDEDVGTTGVLTLDWIPIRTRPEITGH